MAAGILFFPVSNDIGAGHRISDILSVCIFQGYDPDGRDSDAVFILDDADCMGYQVYAGMDPDAFAAESVLLCDQRIPELFDRTGDDGGNFHSEENILLVFCNCSVCRRKEAV